MPRPATAWIGISGWRYTSWRGHFYPEGLVQRRELGFAAERFNSVEINGSFYSLQRPSSYATWRDQTPSDFLFAVKGGRFITHMLRLKNTEVALANYFASGVLALGHKLGPILWQLPERTVFDAAVIDDFLSALPTTTTAAASIAQGHDPRLDGRALTETDADRAVRHCLEVRHPSFVSDEFYSIAARHGVAVVIADTAGKWPLIRELTADLVYVRLHGSEELYVSGYSEAEIDAWAGDVRDWLATGRDVHVYFDNDVKVHAPFDAMALRSRVTGAR